MTRLSSTRTSFYKINFPVIILISFMGIVAIFSYGINMSTNNIIILLSMFSITLLAIYLYLKYLILDLVDEVWEEGDEFVVKNNSLEDRIPLYDVSYVSYTMTLGKYFPQRITLHLINQCIFGKEITFTPVENWLPIIANSELDNLTYRVEKSKTSRLKNKLKNLRKS